MGPSCFQARSGIHLSCVDATWKQEANGTRSLALHWEDLDAALDAADRMKAALLFMFAGMPRPIASKPPADNAAVRAHPAQYVPADFRHWDEYVTEVVRYLVKKGHRGACYEVWNEPEDYHESWRKTPGADTLMDYLALYLHTSRAIKAADPAAKVGGPVCAHWDSVAASSGGHSWGVRQFLHALARYRRAHPNESVPLDFVSWHDYSFLTPVLSDGVDFVDKALTEAKWPAKPEYWITEWNRDLGGENASAPHRRASHAAWNILREANPQTRRVARLYYYVLDDPNDSGEDVALADEPPPIGPQRGSPSTRVPRPLNPSYAVFEMVREMDQGVHLPVTSERPAVALATIHEGVLRLMVNNKHVRQAVGAGRTAERSRATQKCKLPDPARG